MSLTTPDIYRKLDIHGYTPVPNWKMPTLDHKDCFQGISHPSLSIEKS
jgi:hypothetical protein